MPALVSPGVYAPSPRLPAGSPGQEGGDAFGGSRYVPPALLWCIWGLGSDRCSRQVGRRGGFGSRVPCWADAGPRALVPLVPCHSTLPWIRDALPPALGHGPPFMRGPCPTLTSSRSALRLRVGSMLGGLGLYSLGPRHHGHGLWEQLALQLRSPAIDALGPGIRASVVTRIWAGHPRGARGGLAREAPRPQAQDGAGSGF